MKNLFNYLVAFAAIIMGFAMSACTPDTPEPGAGVSVAVVVDETTAATVSISVKTQGIKEFAYILDKEVAATAILAGGTKVEVDSPEENVTLQNLEPNTSYKAYFAFRQNDGKIYKDVVVAEFTTGSYGDNVLTVVDQR